MTSTSQATCPSCGAEHTIPRVEVLGVVITKVGCPACHAAEKERCAQADADMIAARGRAYFERICPPLYMATDPAKLPAEQLKTTLAWELGSRGLLLVGPTRAGKTRIAYLLLHKLAMQGVQMRAFDCAGFAHGLAREFGKKSGAAEHWLDVLARSPLVFFDDIGKAPFTERVEAELYALVERRTASLLPIIGTMNMRGAGLIAKTTEDRGGPLVRRLREFCQIVDFKEKGEK